ncbi:hypothetical protein [Sorangium sp. So ce854]|uniref:hypothetical protein n=1 Tax=Sorangium sp. So ce854 TaxID=3133322 RepID=UPI003F5D847A
MARERALVRAPRGEQGRGELEIALDRSITRIDPLIHPRGVGAAEPLLRALRLRRRRAEPSWYASCSRSLQPAAARSARSRRPRAAPPQQQRSRLFRAAQPSRADTELDHEDNLSPGSAFHR